MGLCYIDIPTGGVLMIKGALALALMSTVGMGGMVSVSSNGDITTSYYVPPLVVMNHGHHPPPPPRVAPTPVVQHVLHHQPHKPLVRKDHKPAPPKAKKPNKPSQKPAAKPNHKGPAKKGNSKGGKR